MHHVYILDLELTDRQRDATGSVEWKFELTYWAFGVIASFVLLWTFSFGKDAKLPLVNFAISLCTLLRFSCAILDRCVWSCAILDRCVWTLLLWSCCTSLIFFQSVHTWKKMIEGSIVFLRNGPNETLWVWEIALTRHFVFVSLRCF